MNDAIAYGQRAAQALEIVGPMLDAMREDYVTRIADVATKELDPKARTDKVTCLSYALRIVDNVKQGLGEAIQTGQIAEKALIRSDQIERMSPAKRRLFDIAPAR